MAIHKLFLLCCLLFRYFVLKDVPFRNLPMSATNAKKIFHFQNAINVLAVEM